MARLVDGGRVARVLDAWPVAPGEDLTSAVRWLAPDVVPDRVAAAGDLVALAVGALVAFSAFFVVPPSLTVAIATLAGVGIATLARRLPVLAAAISRGRALGNSSSLFARLTLRLRVEPSLERAVDAAAAGEGRLAASLHEHARRATGAPDSGLLGFAAAWAEVDPALSRASDLVVAAADAPRAERERTLDRALATVREGTRDRLAAFAADLRPRLTGLYAVGVLLPLALVGVLPAARTAGATVPLWVLAVGYDLVLPVGLVAGSLRLLAARPAAFPPPVVTRSHPAVPDRRVAALAAGVGSAVAAGCLAWLLVPWSAPLLAPAVGVGIGLLVLTTPHRRVRDRTLAVEAGLPDALSLVGDRVGAGESVESALAGVGDDLSGETGALLTNADRVARTLGLGLRDAVLGPRGVARHTSSRRLREAVALLALASREGRPAGEVLVAAGDDLRDLRRIEAEARRELAGLAGTLANTAALFGPLVGGVTVAMAARLARDGTSVAVDGATAGTDGAGAASALAGASAYPPELLGPVVGTYVLLLAAVLAALAGALETGLDPTVLARRVAVALPAAAVAYLTGFLGAGLLL